MGQTVEIRCLHCGMWQPSQIFIDIASFDSATLAGNMQQCVNPKCRKMTACNKENMRIRTADSGFVGDQT